MRAVPTIALRELSAASGRPQAGVILAVFVALLGVLSLWFDDPFEGGVASMRRPFAWMAVCLVLGVPAMTMGCIAQERRTGTLLLLQSLPISTASVVVGKWLATLAMVGLSLLLTLPWPIALMAYGEPELGPILGGYLGLLLAGGALAAVGVAASAVAETQVVAFLLASSVGVLAFGAGYALRFVPPGWVGLAQWFTFDHHFANLAGGVLDSRSVVFFASVTAWFLLLAVQVLELRRLR
ncbi:MAG: ABC transporter permease [Myxococcales bacterium]|nr:ABC transporter permease [Myxococcales bacterium]